MSLLQKVKNTSPVANDIEQYKTKSPNGQSKLISGDKFALFINFITSGIIYIDSDYKLQYANTVFEKIFKLNVHSALEKPIADSLGDEVFLSIKHRIETDFLDAPHEMEISLEEDKIFIDITIISDIGEHGVVNGYFCIINDNSEKVRTAKELKRKQIEHDENLQDSNNRYQALIENIPAALYSCDSEGRITLYNKAAAELWGREPEVGKDMWCGSWKIYESDGNTPVELDVCPMAITLKEGQLLAGREVIIERPDGKRRNVQPYPIPIFDKNGKVTGAVNMLLDITDRKIAEKELAHMAAIIHSSADPIISKTLTGLITSWNKAAERLFGYTAQEMIGQSILKLIPDDRLSEESGILERLKKGEVVEHFETKRITKNKKELDISLSISPIKDKEGNIIGASKIARDITAQKILLETLRESEERLRMASESTQLGTWEFNPISKKLIWSKECKAIYGVPYDFEPTGEFVSEHMHPDDRQYVHEQVVKVMDPDNKENFQIEYRIFRASDKQLRWLKIRGKVYFDLNKKAKRFLGNILDITEEKLAQQIIHESEERLRMAIQSTKLGTWEFFPLTGALTWSEECKKIYGVPGNVPIDYQFFLKHIYPEDAEFVMSTIQNAMNPNSDGNYDIQYRILRYNNKEPRWIRAQGKVYFNLNKQAERFIGTVIDISEEKAQEQKLKSSIELFTTMADNVPAMIWMSGEDKFCDYFNKTWLEFTGRTIDQESNEGWLESVHPDDVQKCIDDYQRSYNEQKGLYTEYRLKRYDGEYRWIADNSVPRYNEDGSFAGFISACIDIDDQKNFREKIMQSELRLKTISNASPVGLWMTDVNAQNIFVNDTWIEWTGQPLEKQLGVGWLDRVHEEDKLNAPSKFRECMINREKYSTEFRIIKPNGEMRWCLTEGSPYYNIDGEFAGYAGSVTDITDMKKMEERKDDFIKMASHELKTPVTSIKGYVQLLLNIYNELNEEKFQASRQTVKSSLNTISKQVSKLTRLISELLDLSRIESGKLELHKTEFDLSDLLEETVEDVRHATSQHAIIIYNDFKGNIYADKDRISQVLLNLLTNAIKYSPEADNVEIFLEGNKKNVTIKVKDHGIGIDKKDFDKIFGRFYRVEGKSEQTYPGFGIGLFIASEIVQRHNGTISVESKKDKGSVFTVILPLKEKQ